MHERQVNSSMMTMLHELGRLYRRTSEGKSLRALSLSKATEAAIKTCLPNVWPIYEATDTNKAIATAYDDQPNDNVTDQVTARLEAIFDEIGETPKTPTYWRLTTSDQTRVIQALPEEKEAQTEYDDVWDNFKQGCNALPSEMGVAWLNQLYALMKHTLCNVPALAHFENPKISLFERIKIATAMVACLEEESLTKSFTLLDYDLSGMQDYIYSITEGGETKRDIAKSIRGRSFYLSLISDFIGYAFLEAFHLPPANLLISAGGRGLILLPKTTKTEAIIIEVKKRIEKALFERHRTELSVAFSTSTVQDIRFEKDIDLILEVANQGLMTGKKQKYASLLNEGEFTFIGEAMEDPCPLCEREKRAAQTICMQCKEAIQLSESLTKHQALTVIYDSQSTTINEALTITFGDLGSLHVCGSCDPSQFHQYPYLTSFNHPSIGDIKYLANVHAKGKSFSDIATDSRGDKKIAVIKMDVDDLGFIFARGLHQDQRSFGKVLTLSRQLDHFFTHDLSSICQQDKYKGNIYISYAGGDDLVIISPACDALQLVHDINQAFYHYTGKNNALHLSSGIEIFAPKTPIRFAVKNAETLLKKAKSIEGKNSIGILEQVIANQRLKGVMASVDDYVSHYQNGALSKGVLYNLYTALSLSVEDQETMKRFYQAMPHLAYAFERNISKVNVKQSLKQRFVNRDINLETVTMQKVALGMTLLEIRK